MSFDFHRLFAGLDDRSLDRLSTRRDAVLAGGRAAAGLALGAVPLALVAGVRDAAAQGPVPARAAKVLNFALTLEYLEATFYNRGLRAGVVPGKDRHVFETIQGHENAHVTFLRRALGSQAIAKPKFDFTAGGAIPDPFKNYEVFKVLAQGFEDTGVRAYKGQLAALKPFDVYLTAAVTIHSVEARHAAQVRRIRERDGWVPFEDVAAPVPISAVYAGEGNLQQLGINVGAFQGDRSGSEAYDEPLNREDVLAIAGPFLA